MSITLKQALILTDDIRNDSEVIRLSWPVRGKTGAYTDEIVSVRRIKNQYDLKALRVRHIEPVFHFQDYDGMRYILAAPKAACLRLYLEPGGRYTLADQDGRIQETGRVTSPERGQLIQDIKRRYDMPVKIERAPQHCILHRRIRSL